MGDADEMGINQIRDALSNLLGVERGSVFDFVGKNSSSLSDWAYDQLVEMVELPEGYSLTRMIRIPNAGEFFLDIETLVAEERVVVYKALDVVKNLNIVLDSEQQASLSSNELTPNINSNSFDIFMCMLQGGVAKHDGQVVRLLVPAVDSKDLVVIVKKGVFELVDISTLQHLNNTTEMSDSIPSANLLPDTTFKNLPKSKNKYGNRFDLTFDDTDT